MITVGALIARGRTSEVFEYGAGSVVKVPNPEVPTHWADMEARFTAAVHAIGVPAPAVEGLVEVGGRQAIVFERIEGRSMWDHLLEAPHTVATVGADLAALHHNLLRAGLPTAVLGLVDRLEGKVKAVRQFDEPTREAALAKVRSLPRGAALLHGDLHPSNVLMSPKGPVVIDWFDVTIGHPVADVVRTSILMRPEVTGPLPPHMPGATRELQLALLTAYLDAMAPTLAGEADSLADWEAVLAASRLAERTEFEEQALLSLWDGRPDEVGAPLLHAALARSSGENSP